MNVTVLLTRCCCCDKLTFRLSRRSQCNGRPEVAAHKSRIQWESQFKNQMTFPDVLYLFFHYKQNPHLTWKHSGPPTAKYQPSRSSKPNNMNANKSKPNKIPNNPKNLSWTFFLQIHFFIGCCSVSRFGHWHFLGYTLFLLQIHAFGEAARGSTRIYYNTMGQYRGEYIKNVNNIKWLMFKIRTQRMRERG